MKVHYIMHASFETPGCIDQWAADRGHHYTGTHTYRGETLPPTAEVDFLIVMGGPQSPLRIERYPYLRDEVALRFTVKYVPLIHKTIGYRNQISHYLNELAIPTNSVRGLNTNCLRCPSLIDKYRLFWTGKPNYSHSIVSGNYKYLK
jgi:hypothetical protein